MGWGQEAYGAKCAANRKGLTGRHDRSGVRRQTGNPTHGPAGAGHVHRRLSPGTRCHCTGYAVTWKKGTTWKGHKSHIGWGQEADCEGSPGSSNQEPRAPNNHLRGRAGGHLEDDIRRPRSRPEIRDHGQKHIAALRTKEPGICIEIRWCPSHQGIEGNEIPYGTSKS